MTSAASGVRWKTIDAFDFSFDVVMAMPCSKLEEQPMVTCPGRTCPGAHKKLDRRMSGFRQKLQKLWASGAGSEQARPWVVETVHWGGGWERGRRHDLGNSR